MKNTLIVLMLLAGVADAGEQYYYQGNQKITLTPYHDRFTRQSNVDYYKSSKDLVIGVTEKIIIKTRDGIDIAKYLNTFKLAMIKELDSNIYLLRTSDKSLTIETANRLSKQEDIVYAHPDFIKRRVLR